MDPIYDLNPKVPNETTQTFRAPTTGTTGVRDEMEVTIISNMPVVKDAPSEAPWRSGDHDGIITAN